MSPRLPTPSPCSAARSSSALSEERVPRPPARHARGRRPLTVDRGRGSASLDGAPSLTSPRAAQLGKTVRVTWSQLSVSPGGPDSQALFVSVPCEVGLNTSCTTADWFTPREPLRVHVTMPLSFFPTQLQAPLIELADAYPAFLVNVSTTCSPVAFAGPPFVTLILKVTGCPRCAVVWLASG